MKPVAQVLGVAVIALVFALVLIQLSSPETIEAWETSETVDGSWQLEFLIADEDGTVTPLKDEVDSMGLWSGYSQVWAVYYSLFAEVEVTTYEDNEITICAEDVVITMEAKDDSGKVWKTFSTDPISENVNIPVLIGGRVIYKAFSVNQLTDFNMPDGYYHFYFSIDGDFSVKNEQGEVIIESLPTPSVAHLGKLKWMRNDPMMLLDKSTTFEWS